MGQVKEWYNDWRQTFRTFAASQAYSETALDHLIEAIADEYQIPEDKVCIAGGYLRDCATGKQPKDVDVFIELDYDLADRYSAIVSDRRFTNLTAFEAVDPGSGGGSELWNEYEEDRFFDGETWKVNVIILKPREEFGGKNMTWIDYVLSRFDFGICQIGWSKKKGCLATKAFERDLRNKTFTHNPTIGDYRRDQSLLVRWPRISKRYENWKLVEDGTQAAA